MLTQAKVKELFNFNNETGVLSWINKSEKGGFQAGRPCDCLDVHGYIQINIKGKIYKGHRIVWLYVHGEFPEGQIDHINHNRIDNRIENLRIVNNQINHLNRPIQRNNKTGFVGVSFLNGKYRAYITINGKHIHLGQFKTIEEAIEKRKEANKLYGFHENHGVGMGVKKYKRY